MKDYFNDYQNVGDYSSENQLYIWDIIRNVKAALVLNFERQTWLSKLLLKKKSWIFIICSLSLVSPVTSRYLLSLFPRLWVLRDQRQGQHQCEADLRTSRWPYLRQDVRELGQWSGRHHRSSHCQTHRHRSAPPAARMQLLVTDVRRQRGGKRRSRKVVELCPSSALSLLLVLLSLDYSSNPV